MRGYPSSMGETRAHRATAGSIGEEEDSRRPVRRWPAETLGLLGPAAGMEAPLPQPSDLQPCQLLAGPSLVTAGTGQGRRVTDVPWVGKRWELPQLEQSPAHLQA